MSTYNNFKHTELTSKIIKAAYKIHDYFGFGHLESIYEKALAKELTKQGFQVAVQHPIKVYYEGDLVGDFKADLIVNNQVILELKAIETLHPRHEVQLVNYLKSTEIEVGLLINFGEELLVKRKVFDNMRKRIMKRIPQ